MQRNKQLASLYKQIDASFSKQAKLHPLNCRAGCAGCCTSGIEVSPLEAEWIRMNVQNKDLPPRARFKNAQCAFLDAAKRCSIYEWRPAVCRSHGIPVRWTEAETAGAEFRDLCELQRPTTVAICNSVGV